MLKRLIIPFIPFNFWICESDYNAEVVMNIIQSHIISGDYFEGYALDGTFKIHRRRHGFFISGFKQYIPEIQGEIIGNGHGSTIKLSSRLNHEVLLIEMLIIIIVLITGWFNHGPFLGDWLLIGFLYLGTIMMYKLFYSESRDNLEKLFKSKG